MKEEIEATIRVTMQMPTALDPVDQELDLLARLRKALGKGAIVKILEFKGEAEIYKGE